MAGRLMKENIRTERIVGKGEALVKTQAAAVTDGERNVRITAVDARCTALHAETQAEGIAVQGSMEYDVLYLTQSGELRRCAARNAFSTVMPVEGTAPGQRASVKATVCGAAAEEHDGKLQMGAQLMLTGLVTEEIQLPAAKDAAVEEEMAKRFTSLRVPDILPDLQMHELLSEDFPIGQEEMTRVVWEEALPEITSVRAMDGAALIEGVVRIACLLAGENVGETGTQHAEIPFAAELANDRIRSGMELFAEAWVRDTDAQLRMGELEEKQNILHIECILELSVVGKEMQEINVLQDLYPLSETPFEAVYEQVRYLETLNDQEQTVTIESTLDLPSDAPAIRRIIGAFASVVMLEAVAEEEMRAEGLLRVTLLYRTDGEETPVSYEQEVPFSVTFDEVSGFAALWRIKVEEVQAQRSGPLQAQVRVELEMEAQEAVEVQARLVKEIDFDGEPVEMPAGITLYYPENGESTWEIAKRYRVREEALRTKEEDGKAAVMVYRRLTAF